ncbi:MAG: glycosyltransferase [Xanthobacteraceae bacterium]|jgi:glycosyltransferase involved in cell wall biosynthesis
MSTPLRIAYLSIERPHEGNAAYTHVHEIVAGLRRRGHDVDLYAPPDSDEDRSAGLPSRIVTALALQARLMGRWRDYDAIYVRGHYLAAPLALLARLTGKPIYHEVNGPFTDLAVTHPWTRHIEGPLRALQRFQYRWADGLAAVTPQLERWLRSEGCESKIAVIPNGANLDRFNPDLPRRPGLPERYVIFFGGFARWQGIPVMLDAVRDPAWPKGVMLVLAGDGQMRPEVQEAARGSEKIVYLGKLRYSDIGAAVAGAIAGLVAKTRGSDSDDTGLFPVKLFEILACGVPAIVTDYPGQADLVRSADCGVVLPPNDAAALARAVAKLADDPGTAAVMGRRGHEIIVRLHSWDQRAGQTAGLIAQAGRG